jgi:hypothetical protein
MPVRVVGRDGLILNSTNPAPTFPFPAAPIRGVIVLVSLGGARHADIKGGTRRVGGFMATTLEPVVRGR